MGRTRARTEPAKTRVRPWSRSARTGVSAPPIDAMRVVPASNEPGADPTRTSSAEPLSTESPARHRNSGHGVRESGPAHSTPGQDRVPAPSVNLFSGYGDRVPARVAGSDSGSETGSAAGRHDRTRSGAAAGASARGSRTGSSPRNTAAERGIGDDRDRLARMPDALREAGEFALHTVRKWADPRERELRKRRRVRRRSLRWSAASGMTVLGTAGLVAISAPVWAVVVVGGGTVALVTGAAVSTRRYLELRRNPLPPAAFVPRRLPAVRSAARAPVARLVRAERAMYALGRHIADGGRLPADDLTDTLATADSGAAALHALAGDIAAMEQAVGVVADSRCAPQLSRQLDAMVERLESGVGEYEQLVSAAGRILAAPPATGAPADEFGWAMLTLREAADRLDGWAQALTDLADRH
ncbi:hypothetical protein NONO_c54120 [Nocardia nova SH22a]|uniref:Uncharacterized protein n=1 Tax=Nocardia nova SH22a TaxID=1415166 RepID=W5TLN7_9NOCA|nr:hypothetical protein [Nocardia nova]AHH20192.1 hypothetical protein NONO_c54120 [Nocardia nova SH22a]